MRMQASFEDIALTWVAYYLWRATTPRSDAVTPEAQIAQDEEDDRNGFWACEAVDRLVLNEPEAGWSMIVRLVELAPDDRTLAMVAAGPLEDLLCRQPYAFIDRVEERARSDKSLRRCVSGVWGWSRIPEDVQDRMRRIWEGEDPL